jgi:1-acyl-sn-glycerol-3-phosphate acyltransferase
MREMLGTLVSAIRSLAAYVAVSLYVLVTGPPGMLLAFLFHWKGVLYILGHGGVTLGTRLAGIRYRVAGREQVPRDRAVVFCANHQSNVDPPVLYRVLHPRLHILYKAELQKLPVLGRAFGLGGFVPIDRSSRERSVAALDQAAQSLRAGNSFLTFPEGTRSRTGALLPFKKGAFILAIKAQAPILPVAVQGGTAAMRRGSALIRPVTVSIRIGPLIETQGLKLSERDHLIARVRESIERLLAEGPVGA